MDEIMGYYDYYYDEYEYSRRGEDTVKTYIDKTVSDVEKFFWKDDKCPFCKSDLQLVFSGSRSATAGKDMFYSGKVFECHKCGWWTYKTHFVEEYDYIQRVDGIYTDTRHYAITKSFDIDDKMLPIEVLKTELKKKPEMIYGINPYKLEELSQDILRGIYDCEVHHVGRRGDGGTDLIILESDDPILVQVKCRQNPEHIELVKGVREFVGTMFIEDKRKGIYISTAKSFSKGSVDVAERLIKNRKLDFLEFVNYDKLHALIKRTEEKKIWKTLVGFFYQHNDALVYDDIDEINEYIKSGNI